MDLTPPNPPASLTETATAYDTIHLIWPTATDYGNGVVARYKVYRAGALVAQPTATTADSTDKRRYV